MRASRIIVTLVVGLAATACGQLYRPPDTRVYSEHWFGGGLYPAEPKTVSLTILQPPKTWGPVTLISRDGRLPVQLSQEGVSVEAAGSSSAETSTPTAHTDQ